jgi:hypothetical protein
VNTVPFVLIFSLANSFSSSCVSFSKCDSDQPPEKHRAAISLSGISAIFIRVSKGLGVVSRVNSFGITNAIVPVSERTGDVIWISSDTTGDVIFTLAFCLFSPVINLYSRLNPYDGSSTLATIILGYLRISTLSISCMISYFIVSTIPSRSF